MLGVSVEISVGPAKIWAAGFKICAPTRNNFSRSDLGVRRPDLNQELSRPNYPLYIRGLKSYVVIILERSSSKVKLNQNFNVRAQPAEKIFFGRISLIPEYTMGNQSGLPNVLSKSESLTPRSER